MLVPRAIQQQWQKQQQQCNDLLFLLYTVYLDAPYKFALFGCCKSKLQNETVTFIKVKVSRPTLKRMCVVWYVCCGYESFTNTAFFAQVSLTHLGLAQLSLMQIERGHKPRCCKVQIVFLLVAVVFIIVVVFGVPNSLLL
ncbi:unnamed protein product [Polarella glacialis]|uniref:Uncharacterized protein n=1 Tax=Polarella glacialis TaxID=89957 RepID=A0A813DCP6_POLGL|nr:unnamed protein product [Polarella glacialis]